MANVTVSLKGFLSVHKGRPAVHTRHSRAPCEHVCTRVRVCCQVRECPLHADTDARQTDVPAFTGTLRTIPRDIRVG